MTYIKYLFLALVAAVMLPSCADEGPEQVGSLECSAAIVSVTPTSATIDVTYPTASMIDGISGVILTSNYEETYSVYTGETIMDDEYYITRRYIITNLTPDTEYQISVDVEVHKYETDWGTYEYSHLTLVPSGDSKFTTKAEGDYSDIARAHTEYLGITNTTASFQVFFDDETMMMLSDYGSVSVKYGTTPDLSGSDTREIIYDGYNNNNYFQEDGLIMNGENHIEICLINLKEDTKYYFSVTGNFRYRPSTDWYDEVTIENVTLVIPDNSFTTTSGEQYIGKFTYASYTAYDTSVSLSVSAPSSYEFAPASLGYDIHVVYSTSPDFSDAVDYSRRWDYDYFNNSLYCEIPNLTPGTTYYYYIIASFVNTEHGYPAVVYQNVKVEGADGYGTFTTQSSYY